MIDKKEKMISYKFSTLLLLISLFLYAFSCNIETSDKNSNNKNGLSGSNYAVFFDDFTYTGPDDHNFSDFHWTVRNGSGGPGPADCSWSTSNVEFIPDPDDNNNTIMRLKASTNGIGATCSQAEVYHDRKYLEGTYASRIRFTDAPYMGSPDKDQINETFFVISPLEYDMAPDYSEVDFVEYLANGGWGKSQATFWMTSRETYDPDTWAMDSISDSIEQSFEGWHIVTCVIYNGEIKFYIDGLLQAVHSGKYYPESLMSINYNLWFINEGLDSASTPRAYVEDIDWIYHAKNTVVSTVDIVSQVAQYRTALVSRVDDIN